MWFLWYEYFKQSGCAPGDYGNAVSRGRNENGLAGLYLLTVAVALHHCHALCADVYDEGVSQAVILYYRPVEGYQAGMEILTFSQQHCPVEFVDGSDEVSAVKAEVYRIEGQGGMHLARPA